jgi:hypothetical protein
LLDGNEEYCSTFIPLAPIGITIRGYSSNLHDAQYEVARKMQYMVPKDGKTVAMTITKSMA